MQKKAINAAKAFIERKGCEVLATEWIADGIGTIDIVAMDEDAIVFADVTYSTKEDGFKDGRNSRREMEMLASMWLSENADKVEGDVRVRFDRIDLVIISADRAILQHHSNCYGFADESMAE